MEPRIALQNLGLNEKEADIYLSLLELGRANVARIATAAEIKRPTAYLILEDLRKKGLVLKIPHTKNVLYAAQDPDIFFKESTERVQQATTILPQLKALHKKDTKVSTRYFEGDSGIRDALLYRSDELHNSEIVGFFAKSETLSTKLLEVSHEWRKTMNKIFVTVRGIAPEHASLEAFRKTDGEMGQSFKSVPFNEYSSDVSIDATEHFVRIVLFGAKQAIIIENPAIVATVKQIFELSWKNLK